MSADLIHKRRADWAALRGGPASICGRYGYVHARWAKVTCDVCRKRKGKP